jgi:malate dehydrogenase (oxaloacetate-decarboxylating)
VFHDDQHGTAVVVLAALINSLKIIQKRPEDLKVCVLGVGASGVACSKIMMNFGVKNVIGFDRQGAVYQGRQEHMNPAKEWFAEHTNPEGFDGTLEEALDGADMFLGLSGPNLVARSGWTRWRRTPSSSRWRTRCRRSCRRRSRARHA